MSTAISPEVLATAVSYVPPLLLRRFARQPVQTEADVEVLPVATLLADISGFTPLAERLAQQGAEGAEQLTLILNRYFGALLELISAHGGEVVKFAGDAVLAFWPGTPEGLDAAIQRAAQCALDIQQTLNRREVAPDIELSQRVAVDAGEIHATFVGGVYGRWEMLLAGEPINRMGRVLHLIQPGEVVVSDACWTRLSACCRGQTLAGATRLEAIDRPLDRVRPDIPTLPSTAEAALWSYIPAAIRARLAAGQTGWLSELRRVSVIFLNLPELDPSRAGALAHTQTIMRSLQTALYRQEGSINKLTVDDKGATLVAVLGLPPLSHEDDPERALAAAMEMEAVLRSLEVRAQLGVGSGVVLCGNVGNDLRREYTVMGDVVNLTARLMQVAADGLLCDGQTFAAARSAFHFQELGQLEVKGKSEPVDVYRPLERLGRHKERGVTFGRDGERALLGNLLDELSDGEASLLMIEGEPGAGKSQLVHDLLTQARARGVTTLVRTGDATERSTPYHAWRPIFAQMFDVEVLNDPDKVREHVLAQLEVDQNLAELAPLLSAVLPVDLPETPLTAQLSGAARAAKTQALLVHLLQDVAETGHSLAHPLVLVLEDAHWLDTASWELVERVSNEVSPLLLALATRPMAGSQPAEYGRLLESSRVQRIQLGGLGDSAVSGLICDRLNVDEVPQEMLRFISERAQGNPFFALELAYAFRDSGLVEISGRSCRLTAGNSELSPLALPSTIQGVITSRIDRLKPQEQLLLKVASVFGPAFRLRVLRDVYPLQDEIAGLDEGLAALQALDFLEQEGDERELGYRFRQTVTREVSYNLMLFDQRRRLHRSIAEWHETHEASERPNRLELLAWHWSGAEELEQASSYYEMASDQAYRNGAFVEARRFLTLALTPKAGQERRARLHRKIATVLWEQGSRQAAEAELNKALDLLAGQTEAVELAHVFQEHGRFAFRQGRNEQAQRWAQQALDLAERLSQEDRAEGERREAAAVTGDACNTLAAVLARTGRPLEAVHMAERAVQLAAEHDLHEVGCRAYTNLGVLYSSLDPSKAIEASAAGLALAQKIGHLPFQSWLYANLAGAYCTFTGSCEIEGLAAAKSSVELDRQLGQIDHLAVPLIVMGQIYQCNGSAEAALQCFREAAELAEEMQDPQLIFPCYEGLATVYLEMGDDARGEEYLLKSQALCEEAGLDAESLVVLPFLC